MQSETTPGKVGITIFSNFKKFDNFDEILIKEISNFEFQKN